MSGINRNMAKIGESDSK